MLTDFGSRMASSELYKSGTVHIRDMNLNGFTHSNSGQIMDEADIELQNAAVIWCFGMFEELRFRPGSAACTTPTLAGSAR